MSTAVPVIQQDGEGEKMWFAGGGIFTWKVTAAQSGGAFLLLEDHMEQGKCTPYHLHPNQDEAIYIIKGEILVDIEGEQTSVSTGGMFFAPRGVAHAFMVTSESAQVLAVITPGDGESFYRAAGEPVRTEQDAQRPADFARLRAVAEEDDSIEILGPPPFGAPVAAAAEAG